MGDAQRIEKCLKVTKITMFAAVSVLLVLLIAMEVVKVSESSYHVSDIGYVVVLAMVWTTLLVSICLLRTKTKVFLGDSFSTEKCEIYTMFSALSIGYLLSILVNVFLMGKFASDFETWFTKEFEENSIGNGALLLVIGFYMVS